MLDGTVILDKDKADAFNNKSISVNKGQHLLAIFPCALGDISECSCVKLPFHTAHIQKSLIMSQPKISS